MPEISLGGGALGDYFVQFRRGQKLVFTKELKGMPPTHLSPFAGVHLYRIYYIDYIEDFFGFFKEINFSESLFDFFKGK